MKKTNRILASAAVFAAVALGATACAPAPVVVGSDIEATVAGTTSIALTGTAHDDDATTATLKLSAAFNGGNININGVYNAGDVRFTLKGIALAGVIPMGGNEAPHTNGAWVYGGCLPVPTYYTSTNRSLPGSGVAVVYVCDNSDANGVDTVQIELSATEFNNAANGPFAGYSAQGTISGKHGGVVLRKRGPLA